MRVAEIDEDGNRLEWTGYDFTSSDDSVERSWETDEFDDWFNEILLGGFAY